MSFHEIRSLTLDFQNINSKYNIKTLNEFLNKALFDLYGTEAFIFSTNGYDSSHFYGDFSVGKLDKNKNFYSSNSFIKQNENSCTYMNCLQSLIEFEYERGLGWYLTTKKRCYVGSSFQDASIQETGYKLSIGYSTKKTIYVYDV